jgi:dipeptidyl aminopeptidase/acylaminoacyl peptidase
MKRFVLILVSAMLITPIFAVTKNTYTFAEKDGQELKLDVYMPEDSLKEHPCMIFAFGGGFKMGARDEASYQNFLTEMAENGVVGMSIDYRLGLAGVEEKSLIKLANYMVNAITMAVEDMASAVKFAIDNAEQFKINPNQIIISGSSAGAITALQTQYYQCNSDDVVSVLPKDFKFAGVVSFAGAVMSFGGKLKYKTQPAPVLFMHGTEDGMVQYNKLEIFNRGMYGPKYLISKIWEKNKWPYMALRFKNFGHEVAMIGFKENVPTILEFIEKFVLNPNKIYVTDVTIAEQGVNEPLLQLGTDGLYGDAQVIISDEVAERIK